MDYHLTNVVLIETMCSDLGPSSYLKVKVIQDI